MKVVGCHTTLIPKCLHTPLTQVSLYNESYTILHVMAVLHLPSQTHLQRFSTCACVCVCERDRERESACACVREKEREICVAIRTLAKSGDLGRVRRLCLLCVLAARCSVGKPNVL